MLEATNRRNAMRRAEANAKWGALDFEQELCSICICMGPLLTSYTDTYVYIYMHMLHSSCSKSNARPATNRRNAMRRAEATAKSSNKKPCEPAKNCVTPKSHSSGFPLGSALAWLRCFSAAWPIQE